jgi:hypothetical protein
LLYLATCHAQQGKTATAWVEFTDVASNAQRAGQRDRAEQARARAAELEGKLSRVQIVATGAPAGLKVSMNTREIRDYSTALPLDPGPLTIEASAPGRASWTKSVDVAPGPSLQTITIPPLPPLPAVGPGPVPVPPGEGPAPPLAADRKARWIAAGTVGGIGVVGIVVGSSFGVLASQQYNDAETHGGCHGTSCTALSTFNAQYPTALRSAYVSTAGFIVGGAALVTGAVVAITIPRADAPAKVQVGAGLDRTLTLGGTF